MRLQNNIGYKVVGEFDVSKIAEEISNLHQEVWERNQSRQLRSYEHQHTKSVFIYDVAASWDGSGYPIQNYFVNENLNQYTDNIVNSLQKLYNGKVGKVLYINLPAGKNIRVHKDHHYYLNSVHRCHIPIITNDKVDFYLNDGVINMKTGICYEINNSDNHGVDNRSELDRIHLLIDIIPMSVFK